MADPAPPGPAEGSSATDASPPTGARATAWVALGAVVGSLATLAALAFVATGLIGGDDEAAAATAPRFVDEARAAGIDHVYDGDFTYFVGGGVAAFDCDDDGRTDLYLAGGSRPAALYRNESPVGGALRFAAVPAPVTDLTKVVGAYPLDVDGDGVTDLAVLRLGENVLLRGVGDCRFERANERWGLDGGNAWTAAFSAEWEDGASLPTLAFGNYLVPSSVGDVPRCADNELVRPAARGDRYAAPIALSPGSCTLSILFSDWDRTGRRDLRMTNDRHYYVEGGDQLWRVAPDEPPRLYTRADGWRPLEIWGMGIASFDLTGDGKPEVFLTSQGDNKLQTLVRGAEGPTYRDVALARGVTAAQPYTGGDPLPSTAWHAEFQDVNNDGLIDLFVSKGNVEAQEGFATRDPDDLLLGEADGTFTEAGGAAGIATFERGRGAALVDLNLDGLLDLVQVNRRANVGLWRNVGSGTAADPAPLGNWVAVRLEQPGPNRDAIGSWVEVRAGGRTSVREVTIGGGHAGGQLGWVHLGLGGAGSAELRVVWPDGERGPWMRLDAGRFAIVERGTAAPRVWTPGEPG